MEKEEFILERSYGYHFVSMAVIIKRLMESRLKPYGLTHLQFSILMNLYKNNVTTQKEMLRYTYGDETSITRLIDRLESKGYIRREPCTEDRRKKKLVLTPEGVALTREVIQCAREVNQELVAGLDGEEAETLLALLQKAHGFLDANESTP